ncbi:neoverrucotoxin subunit beta-like [Cyprinus carpio]|uniref:Neoverrucotoxin subunit beta-like n=1 Tax=Cyprinus carpio TaxID=7962 RepID=A0A9R0AN07_CYPCA|nr:neoverrucotoxin subunit beta-like [Cyprinus carpio]
MVTDEGCCYVSSALTSNSSCLRELDLSYNHPGDSGVKLISEKLEDPNCSLDKFNVDHGGESRITAGLQKYACFLTLDANTAHTDLSLSEENRKVTHVKEKQLYPDHPDRFDDVCQVLCRESVCGRCYWEIEWSGHLSISVSYKSINRKGAGDECVFGNNDQSWCLDCSPDRYSFIHNKIKTRLHVESISSRIGVYVDHSAGTLSFYSVSHTMSLIHTVQTTFTQPPVVNKPPRSVLVRFLRYSQKEVVLKAALKKRDILYNGSRLRFYSDLSAEVLRKHHEFDCVGKSMARRNMYRGFAHQARLRCLHNRQIRLFDSPGSAAAFLETLN